MNIFNNTSILAILLGIAFLFVTLHLGTLKRSQKYIGCLVMLVLSYFVITLDSRAVWLGIGFAWPVVYAVTTRPKNKAHTRIFLCLWVTLTIVLFFYKKDSSAGRLLIHKINFQLLKEHWLTGIQKPYNIAFNHAQADYFQTHEAPVYEQLLAGNGFFPMNEYLNIFLRFGVLGLMTALVLIVLLLKVALKQIKMQPQKKPVTGVVLFLLIVALTSYPFHFGIYSCIFICSAIFILKDEKWWPLKSNKLIFCTYALLFGFFSFKDIKDYQQTKDIQHVSDLTNEGYVNESLAFILNQIDANDRNGSFQYLAAKAYSQKNMLDSAIYYLESTHQYLCTDELHEFWGKCLSEDGKLIEAGSHYQLAVNMVPCRFKNRLSLIHNNIALKNYPKAIQESKLAVQLPEKVPSPQSALYKKKIKAIHDSLSYRL